jgi:hypothetical protein
VNVPEPTVALVFSPEGWVEELHRHLAHHGGARVRQIVVDPAVALDEEYDVLVVSDRWPALTFGFVGAVHDRGRRVLGVFDPEEPAGKDHLVELGVDATVACDATLGELVGAVRELGPATHVGATATVDREPVDTGDQAAGGRLVVVGGTRGTGVTEVALGVAVALSGHRRAVALLDGHDSAPALAGRLGLALEPNVRDAIDACAHGLGSLADCEVPVVRGRGGAVVAVAGHPSAVAAAQVTTRDVLDLVAALRRRHDFVVVDVDERGATSRAIVDLADAVVAVMVASPVGVVRALDWIVDTLGRSPSVPFHLVANQASRSRFHQEEIRSELERTVRPTSWAWLPHDRAVSAAAWDGDPVSRGPFRNGCARVALAIDPDGAGRRERRR